MIKFHVVVGVGEEDYHGMNFFDKVWVCHIFLGGVTLSPPEEATPYFEIKVGGEPLQFIELSFWGPLSHPVREKEVNKEWSISHCHFGLGCDPLLI